jgi:addiction module HigA family antidote
MSQPIEKVAPDSLAKMVEDIRNGFVAVHPGGIFRRRVIEKQGLSVEATADRMGVSRQMLHRVLSGQSSVTADMAVRMAELSRSRPETWLQLQNQFDLAQVVQTSGLYSADLGHQVREGLKQSR